MLSRGIEVCFPGYMKYTYLPRRTVVIGFTCHPLLMENCLRRTNQMPQFEKRKLLGVAAWFDSGASASLPLGLAGSVLLVLQCLVSLYADTPTNLNAVMEVSLVTARL